MNAPYTSPMAVTGAGGFIGAYLVRQLLKKNVPVIAVDDPELTRTRSCSKNFAPRGVRIVSPEEFLREFNNIKPQNVFHMGACSNTEETRADFIRETNLIYSQKLWELCTAAHIPYFYASSAGTYGDGELGFSDDPAKIPQFKPLSLYAQSKQDFDQWVLKQSRTPPQWGGFKFFNVYGPGEDHKGRQASMAFHLRNQLLSTGEMRLYKSYRAEYPDGGQRRDFVYVGDVARVLFQFASGENRSGIYNIGTGIDRSFLDLAHAVAQNLGQPAKVSYIDMPEKLKPQYQYFTRAELANLRAAGFKEKFLSLEEGVAQYFAEDENL